MTTLHHHIAKDILPAELGGSGPPYNTEMWANLLLENEAFNFPDNHTWHEHHELSQANSSPQR